MLLTGYHQKVGSILQIGILMFYQEADVVWGYSCNWLRRSSCQADVWRKHLIKFVI